MILVTGGTGFIGRHLVARLAAGGEHVRVAARGERKGGLPDTVEQVRANVASGEGLAEAMAGADAVAHLVGVIVQRGKQRFDSVIGGGTEAVVREAEKAGVRKLVYVSAIGAAAGVEYPYWDAKWRAEQAVVNGKLNYTVIRPSIVFGPEDDFFNRLAALTRRFPVLPVAGDGKTKFQPIWVEDVVSCLVACLQEGTHDREIVEIGGPEQYTYEELLDIVGRQTGKRRRKLHLPLWLMRPTARVMQSVLPRPPVTTEQLAMLAKDNVTTVDSVRRQFGFEPKRLSDGLDYLSGPQRDG